MLVSSLIGEHIRLTSHGNRVLRDDGDLLLF